MIHEILINQSGELSQLNEFAELKITLSTYSDILELILDNFMIHEILINQSGELSQLNQ